MSRATKTLKGVFLGAWGGGKATLLAVIVALTLAIVTPAMAATGGNFILGKINSATTFSRLSANIAGPAMQLFNTSTAANARALDLVVDEGNSPMTVNSTAGKALNLDADKLDGRDSTTFMANSTYRLGQGQERAGNVLGDGSKVLSQSCLSGDRLLSGGPASVNVNSDVLDSFASDTNTWQARINDSAVSGGDMFTVVVLCADQ
jgi:hypothetical protein